MTTGYDSRFLQARQAIIRSQFSQLNPEQQEAVMTVDGPLLLLAGAGSGKTTVLINRIANLLRFGCGSESQEIPEYIQESDVEFLETYLRAPEPEQSARAFSLCAQNPIAPWNIIAITFTNKAAGELKERLERMLGAQAQDVWAMTFHSACCRILRRDIDRLGYDKHFTIYDTADSDRVMKDILKEMGLDDKVFPARMVLNFISKAKDKQQSPADFQRTAAASGDFRIEKIAQAYEEYQKRLKAANALDFDDIILLTVRLLQENEDVKTYYQKKFRYVLIDEYQDTNHLQYLLTSLLAGYYKNICVVGDDDQSIYRFRGATIENILSFEKQYKGAKVIRLEQNYRSSQGILDAANAVIANNQGRKGKKLWTQNGKGEPIRVYEALNETDEANFIASRIFSMGKGTNFKDFAILYRTNAQSNVLEQSLQRNGIPYRIIGGTRFFDRAEIKDMMAYLSVINNRTDDLRLKRIINTPPRGIGAKTVEMATRIAESAGLPLYSVISDPYSYPALERSANKLLAFVVMIEECAQLLKTMQLPEFYDELITRTGYMAMLTEKHDLESRTRLENVQELRSNLMSYIDSTDEPSLNDFLEMNALYTDIEQYDPDANAVVLMTMHSAKGLEFPHVCLVGLEEGLFPGTRAIGEPEEMEEERRLCYVAITRAKQTLTISFARQRMLYGHTTTNRPSRFLEEIPPQCITGWIKRELPSRSEPVGNYRTSLYGDTFYDPGYQRPRKPARKEYSAFTSSSGNNNTANIVFQKGDIVQHKAFGRGMVISVLPMGNDALLEIAFDKIGTKKLMQKSAGVHMTKA